MNRLKAAFLAIFAAAALGACDAQNSAPVTPETASPETSSEPTKTNPRFEIYASVRLNPDLGHLSDAQLQMIRLLIDAAKITDDIFWQQVWGDKEALLDSIEDPAARRFAEINYGPWDRLANDQPFIEEYGPRPPGARFYPEDMTREEFEAWDQPGKDGLYSIVKRNDAGELYLSPYHEEYAAEIAEIARLLREASELAENARFAEYLRLRADALETGEYQESDMAWMDMKDNEIELVIGPIEVYQDALFNYRAAFETFVLIKDMEWSERLARFAQYMPDLQRGLPVPEEYKAEMPGTDADLNAY
ncbi:MAG: Zn-dependent hydrolase, partial [Xanthomonadales bacterium]|nr:Zn-dependent hydrolase [Xanthomonadales bacterium]